MVDDQPVVKRLIALYARQPASRNRTETTTALTRASSFALVIFAITYTRTLLIVEVTTMITAKPGNVVTTASTVVPSEIRRPTSDDVRYGREIREKLRHRVKPRRCSSVCSRSCLYRLTGVSYEDPAVSLRRRCSETRSRGVSRRLRKIERSPPCRPYWPPSSYQICKSYEEVARLLKIALDATTTNFTELCLTEEK